MLCPVTWCSPKGRLLITISATPLTKEERDDLWRTGGFPDWDYDPQQGEPEPFEYKPSDWGWLNGKIVALDYSATVD